MSYSGSPAFLKENMKDIIISRLKHAYEAVLKVYDATDEPVQKSYLQHELLAMKTARGYIVNAFDVGTDGRYAIIKAINAAEVDLVTEKNAADARGTITGFAIALALIHDNTAPL